MLIFFSSSLCVQVNERAGCPSESWRLGKLGHWSGIGLHLQEVTVA